MSAYDEDDRQRDEKDNRTVALIAAALSGVRQPDAVLTRADKYAEWLDAQLPTVVPMPTEPCHRTEPHPRHKFYDDYDRRVRCEGEGREG